MLEKNDKYGNRDNIKVIQILDKIWRKVQVRDKENKVIAASFITSCRGKGCTDEVRSRKERLTVHLGFCRKCANKGINYGTRAILKKELIANRKAIKEKVDEMSEEKPIKIKTFNQKVIEFDNSDGKVSTFNKIFDTLLGGDQDEELEILDLYTHEGREIKRYYSNGKEKVFRFLSSDNDGRERLNNTVIDTYDLKDGLFLYTYKNVSQLARDLQVEEGTIVSWLTGKRKMPESYGIKLQERKI